MIFFSGCTSKPQSRIKEAEKLYRLGNYQNSRTTYLQIAEDYPKSRQAPEAYYWAGVISYFNLKEPNKALDYFHKTLADYPASEFALSSRSLLAEMYEKEFNEPRLAIGEYQKLIEETPGHANEEEYRYKIGEVYFNQGDIDQSKTEWEELVKKFPGGKWTDHASFQIAMIPVIRGNYEEGLKVLEAFMKQFPQSSFLSEAGYERGVCLEEMDKYEEALAAYNAILPNYPNRAVVEARIKKVEEKRKKAPRV